jgi:polar amino acid transport system substrate-binding protein/cystine transport system substrate-binding protein/membrane-bound lytic murein transglycosylase F
MARLRHAARDFGPFAFVVALLAGVSLLPPDTSLSEVRRVGTLTVCVPDAYPPLVTGEEERPGIDVELLRAVADELGVSLSINRIPAIGRDFNPRNWGLTRAHCQVIAGGVVDAPITRSFLQTGATYAETGWAALAPEATEIAGRDVGVLVLVSGLDRIALSQYLRSREADARIVGQAAELEAAVAEGAVAAGITEALLARQIAARNGWESWFLPGDLPRHDITLGLWKGDLTLKRAVMHAFDDLREDGTVAAILESYLGEG